MPKVLSDFLANLDRENAEKVWLWLDGTPEAVSEMIGLVCWTEDKAEAEVLTEKATPPPPQAARSDWPNLREPLPPAA